MHVPTSSFNFKVVCSLLPTHLAPAAVYQMGMHPNLCTHLKIPYYIILCRKRVGLTAGGILTQKHYTQGGGGGGWVAAYYD